MGKLSAKRTWIKFTRVLRLDELSPFVRRMVIGLMGGTILLLGLVLLVLPGPAVIVIPLGLAILATEFAWARRCVRKARDLFRQAKNSVSGK